MSSQQGGPRETSGARRLFIPFLLLLLVACAPRVDCNAVAAAYGHDETVSRPCYSGATADAGVGADEAVLASCEQGTSPSLYTTANGVEIPYECSASHVAAIEAYVACLNKIPSCRSGATFQTESATCAAIGQDAGLPDPLSFPPEGDFVWCPLSCPAGTGSASCG